MYNALFMGVDMSEATIETVGRYPTSLLLNILSDGMDYAARGFWAQINIYKWYWWYVCDENGEPDTDKINPDLAPDTSLIQMRDTESYDDVYISLNNEPLVQHSVEQGLMATVCGISYHKLPNIVNSDGTSMENDKAWYGDHDVDYEVAECPKCIVWTDITLGKLAEATDWALETHNHLFSWHTHKGIRDDIDYDAIGADCILQKIVLGEVVYG